MNGVGLTLVISVSLALGSQAVCVRLLAAAPIHYRFSFPEPQHHWMQVEATFADLGTDSLELRMSRSSPGRYALHDFAKNVYDVHAFNAAGAEVATVRSDPYGWSVSRHDGSVTVKYKVYGDRLDGTYLAVDTTHAHINMPASIMWAHTLEERPIAVEFSQPPGMTWRVATQLHTGGSPLEFSAPNLQYLMDSPAEFGTPAIREFSVGSSRFRIALHHTGTDAELETLTKDVEKIVVEEGAIYGEYPRYEPGAYTFITDLVPWAEGDGMEHRNSTVITSRGSIAHDLRRVLDSIAHEFFHCWNVERIRPIGLEPFDFDRANLTSELWLAEGFTQYYGPLVLQRAGLIDLNLTARTLGGLVETVTVDPGRLARSAQQMSEMAPFIDGGTPIDRTNWSHTVISYYPFGGAIALALDLTLRDRSNGAVSLDDFMRAMWVKYGKPEDRQEGVVARPYTAADAEATLAEVCGDQAFAHDFFARYVKGHDVANYPVLLSRAGFLVRRRHAGRAWLGDLQLESRGGARVASLVAPTWPLYASGIDQDDELREIDGQRINGDADLASVLQRHKPGETLMVSFVDRAGVPKAAPIRLAEDPHLEVVAAEASGSLTPAQQAFRARWLKSRS